jgi:hypothetical protein
VLIVTSETGPLVKIDCDLETTASDNVVVVVVVICVVVIVIVFDDGVGVMGAFDATDIAVVVVFDVVGESGGSTIGVGTGEDGTGI